MSKATRYVRATLNNAIHYDDCVAEVEVLSECRKSWDKPLVDESYYISSVDRAKQTKLSQGSPDVSCYDYPDGKITFDGEELAKIRRPGLDIAEISQIVKDTAEESNKNLANDVEKFKYYEKLKSDMAEQAENAKADAIATRVASSINKSSKD